MANHMDLAIYDSAGQLACAAEVKGKRGTSTEWAAEFRRNLFAHGGNFRPSFFLIATPDRIYLWKESWKDLRVVDPDYEFDGYSIFSRYLEGARLDQNRLSGIAFEMIVSSWLSDLTRLRDPSTELPDEQRGLIESGFLDALRGGRVEHEVAV